MYIDQVITVNWGALPNREYAMGPLTLFTGGNGTGKTTLADAIQTVMTAARDTFYKFNPGQDESSQRGRYGKTPRTLASYVLGADRNRLARPQGAHSYVALVFRTTPGVEAESAPFTALIGVSADLGIEGKRRAPRTIDQVNLILPDIALGLDDLLADREQDGEDHVVPVERIENHLKKRFGSAAVRVYRDKIGYLKALWGHLRNPQGMAVSEMETVQATRTWSRLMAHSPIGSINDFVRDEILERCDVASALDHMVQSVQTFNQLKQQAEEVEAQTARLRRIEQHGVQIERGYKALAEKRLLLAETILYRLEQERDATREEIESSLDERRGIEHRLAALESELRQADRERVVLQAERNGHPVLTRKGELEEELETLRQEQFDQTSRLLSALETVQKKLNILPQLKSPVPEGDDELAKGLLGLLQTGAPLQALDIGEYRRHLMEVIQKEAGLYQPEAFAAFVERAGGSRIDRLLADIRDRVSRRGGLDERQLLLQQRLRDEHQRLSGELKETEAQLDRLQRGEPPLPRETESALALLRREQPGARPRVLCELIEMAPGFDDWQPVIEAYLGGNRFVILVEPEYESSATRLLKQHRLHRCKIVQGERARRDAAQRFVEPHTLPACLKVDDPTALAYLLGTYGNVKLVGDMETLRWTPRGIMKEGFASSGYTQFPCQARNDELTFGRQARQYRLESLRARKRETEETLARLDERLGALGRLADGLHLLKTDTALEEIAIGLYERAERMTRLRDRIEALDLGEAQSLERRYQAALERMEALQKEKETAIDRKGALGEKLRQLEERLAGLENEQAGARKGLEAARRIVLDLARPDSDYDAGAVIEALAAQAHRDTPDTDELHARIENEQKQFNGHWPNYRSAIREYNAAVPSREQAITLSPQALETNALEDNTRFFMFMAIQHEVRARLHMLEASILNAIREQLAGIKQEIDKAVTNDFVNLVMANIRSGRQQIDELNRTLQQHRFGDEQYEFIAHYREGLHGAYRRFFKAVADKSLLNEDAFSIFDDSQFDAQDIQTRDEIMDKLFQGRDTRVRDELLRMADYREYFDFDIYRVHEGEHISLAEDATGSGGQLETAAYAIRSASVINAFRLNDRRNPRHCRFLLFDETFAKTDEQRSVEILKLLTRSLKLQILFVVPSRSAGVFKPILTHQHVFTKFKSVNAPGELNDLVEIKSEILDNEKITKLWEQHKEEVMLQAALEFDNLNTETP